MLCNTPVYGAVTDGGDSVEFYIQYLSGGIGIKE